MQSKIGYSRFLKIYQESITDGEAKPFVVSFFTTNGEVRSITCHKPLRDIEMGSQNFEPSKGLGYKRTEKKIILFQVVGGVGREKYKSVRIALIFKLNGKIIDHSR